MTPTFVLTWCQNKNEQELKENLHQLVNLPSKGQKTFTWNKSEDMHISYDNSQAEYSLQGSVSIKLLQETNLISRSRI